MRLNIRRYLLLLLALALILPACAGGNQPPRTPGVTSPAPVAKDSPATLAWKTLATDKQLYDTTFQTLALLDKQGKLPAPVKAQAIKLGHLYLLAHNSAVQSLQANQPVNLDAVRQALDAFLQAAAAYTSGVK